jgi:hypothetical protein
LCEKNEKYTISMHLTLKKAGNTLKDKKEIDLEVNKYN